MRPITRRGQRDGAGSTSAGERTADKYDLGRFRLDDLVVGDSTEGIWRAYDKLLNRTVSVRLVPNSDPRLETLRAAACEAARVVDHRVIRVLDVLDRDGALLIVTEWVDGIPLEQLLQTPMTTARALIVTKGVIEGLSAIHESGTTHGRLGPASVMITNEGEIRLGGHCIDAEIFGVAPGNDPRAADVHGIGAVLMAALTARWPDPTQTTLRQPPIVGGKLATPAQLTADLPREIDEYVIRALAAVPGPHVVQADHQPFRTIPEARTAFSALSTTVKPIPTPSPRVTARVDQSQAQRPRAGVGKRTVGVLSALAVIVAAGTIGVNLLLTRGQPSTGAASGQAPARGSTNPSATLEPRLLEVSPPPVAAAPAPSVPRSFPIAAVSAFDPSGAGIVSGPLADFSIDDNVSTAWYTDTYPKQNFAKGKGTGLIVDLGEQRPIRVVHLGLVGNDTDIQIRTADSLGNSLADYTQISKLSGAPGQVTIREPRPVNARYVLIWLTGMPAATNGYRGGISSVDIRSD